MFLSFLKVATLVLIFSTSFSTTWAAEKMQSEVPLGQLEVSGARLGMSMALALKIIAATKPQWSAGLAASSATQDCTREGRAIVNLEFTGGLVSARMDAHCALDGSGGALQDIIIVTRLSTGLSSLDIKSLLISRYGRPTSETPLAGNGIELLWTSVASTNPAAPQNESVTATITTRLVDSVPLSLALHLSAHSTPSVGAEQSRVLNRLPF